MNLSGPKQKISFEDIACPCATLLIWQPQVTFVA